MTNISKTKTTGRDYEIAYKQLNSFIANLQKNSAQYFIDELLTDSERIMIVKRFTAILMYDNNYSPYRVSNTLGISVSTSQRIYRQYSLGSYTQLLWCIKKKEKGVFLEVIGDLILAQASSRARARLLNRVL